MRISQEEVQALARRAHILLGTEELARLRQDLDAAMEQLALLESFEPAEPNQAGGLCDVVRPDEVEPAYSRASMLDAAPCKINGALATPLALPQDAQQSRQGGDE